MTVNIPSRLACAFGWLAIVLVPALLIAAIAVPWTQKRAALDAGIASGQEQLARYRRLVETLPLLREELERVKGNQTFRAFYFNAATPALAGAQLQRQVQEIVTAAGGQLISTQILPETTGEQPARIRVRTQIQGSTEILLAILHAIDQARPFLFIEQVSIRSSARPEEPEQDQRVRRPIRRPPANPRGELTIRLDIFGFVLGGDAR